MPALRFLDTRGVYLGSTDSVRFFAFDGQETVTFSVSREALELLEGGALDPEGCEAAFDKHKERIRQVADREYPRYQGFLWLIKLTDAHFRC